MPDRAGQVRGDRFDEPGVRVGGDETDPAESAGDEVGEEAVPCRSGLGCRDPQAEHFPAPVGVHPCGDQYHGVDHAAAFTDFHGQRVGGDERERAGVAEGRWRNWSTCSSSSAAIRETCDFEREWIPSVFTSLSIRRVETPAR